MKNSAMEVCEYSDDLKTAIETIDSEIKCLEYMREHLSPTLLGLALDTMQHAKGRIIITGMGKSGHIGRKIAASLASTGTPSYYIHPGEASHGDLGMITSEDVVIAISNSGETKELYDILNYCKRFGIKVIGMTKNEESTLATASDILLQLPNLGEACPLGLAPTNSTTATLVYGDILTCGLVKRKGFTKVDFNLRHPGGKLGSILQRVTDLMRKGTEVPLVTENDLMDRAIIEMTNKMLGCVGITNAEGKLTGIITDGDLRRAMNKELMTKSVKEVMTKNPKSIKSNLFASEALKVMNDMKITCLFVIDENQHPLGLLHIHDLLHNGVA
jgi:arabinose-5-phosphate isomerase